MSKPNTKTKTEITATDDGHFMVPLSMISCDPKDNVRLPSLLNLDPMIESIAQNGLETPVLLRTWSDQPERVVTLRGFRRLNAIKALQEQDPVRFKVHFPDGKVKAELATDITDVEAMRIHVDHGNILTLTNEFEVYNGIKVLSAVGTSEADITLHLCTLLHQHNRTSTKKLAELAEIKEKRGSSAYRQALLDHHRGFVQPRVMISKLPPKVEAAYFFKCTGEAPDGYKADDLFPITMAVVRKLKTAFDADAKILGERGLPVHTIENPGPDFVKEWDDAKSKADGRANTPTVRAWSGAKIEDKSKSLVSDGMRNILQLVAGKGAQDPGPADRLLRVAEVVHAHDNKLWKQVEARAKAILDELAAKADKAAEKVESAS